MVMVEQKVSVVDTSKDPALERTYTFQKVIRCYLMLKQHQISSVYVFIVTLILIFSWKTIEQKIADPQVFQQNLIASAQSNSEIMTDVFESVQVDSQNVQVEEINRQKTDFPTSTPTHHPTGFYNNSFLEVQIFYLHIDLIPILFISIHL